MRSLFGGRYGWSPVRQCIASGNVTSVTDDLSMGPMSVHITKRCFQFNYFIAVFVQCFLDGLLSVLLQWCKHKYNGLNLIGCDDLVWSLAVRLVGSRGHSTFDESLHQF